MEVKHSRRREGCPGSCQGSAGQSSVPTSSLLVFTVHLATARPQPPRCTTSASSSHTSRFSATIHPQASRAQPQHPHKPRFGSQRPSDNIFFLTHRRPRQQLRPSRTGRRSRHTQQRWSPWPSATSRPPRASPYWAAFYAGDRAGCRSHTLHLRMTPPSQPETLHHHQQHRTSPATGADPQAYSPPSLSPSSHHPRSPAQALSPRCFAGDAQRVLSPPTQPRRSPPP